MNFRDYANTETSAFVDRLTTAAEAAAQTAAQEIRAAADAEIQQIRAETVQRAPVFRRVRVTLDGPVG